MNASLLRRIGVWAAVFALLLALPFFFEAFQVEQMATWITIAIAACGLNLLTGYNGQISVGHGALFGTGAYATAILMTTPDPEKNQIGFGLPMVPSVLIAVAICFVVGIVIGLPALRIKGLYLALVTLAVAVLFPLAVEQFSGLTGGGGGLSITSPQTNSRGSVVYRKIAFGEMFGFKSAQVRYYLFIAVAVVCFVLTRNLVKSRMGRSLVAIRDNETAAAVSGVPVSTVKILVFGISSALAGVGGALFALNNAQVNPTSFTILASIYFLVAVVVGGPSSIIGPALGAAFYGIFTDLVAPKFPEAYKGATPIILGAVLILLMFFAPGGLVGLFKTTMAKRAGKSARAAGAATDIPSAFAAEQLTT
jgi:branched-chain amino acid transport system permease protein